jgi:hypothetical protein
MGRDIIDKLKRTRMRSVDFVVRPELLNCDIVPEVRFVGREGCAEYDVREQDCWDVSWQAMITACSVGARTAR